jgi:hypothetical protein
MTAPSEIRHQLGRRHVRRRRHQHADLIQCHRTAYDHRLPGLANLHQLVARALGYRPAQNLVPIFRDPHEVILNIANRPMATCSDQATVS